MLAFIVTLWVPVHSLNMVPFLLVLHYLLVFVVLVFVIYLVYMVFVALIATVTIVMNMLLASVIISNAGPQ
jgi:hypothetical protein